MMWRFILVAALVFCGSSGPARAAGEETALRLSLTECIAMAIRNNLGVAIAVLEPESGESGVTLAKEEFLPVFSLGHAWSDERQPSYSWFDGAEEVDQVSGASFAQIRQRLSTGGDLSLEFNTSRYDTNERAITINPSYRSQLKFSFRQPLLRDFGAKRARQGIVIAQYGLDAMRKDMEKTLQDTVYGVEEAFWNLVFAAENLKIKETSLRLAQDLLDRNRKAVAAETIASVNILNAQVQVASREADILTAEAEVNNAEDELKLLTNISAERGDADLLRIVPVASASAEDKDITLDEAVAIALQNRPDLETLRIAVRSREVTVRHAKNQALPDLSLMGSLWSPGVSGTTLIYPDGDPFSDPISRIPGGRSGSLKDVFGFKYANGSLGFTLDIPLGDLTSRAAYAQAKIDLEQGSLELENQKQKVVTKIKIALRETTMNRRRIQALRTARELAEKQLAAEEEKLKAGYSTTYFVLQYQSELSAQQSQELEANIEYRLARARLNRELGTNLAENDVHIDQMPKR